MSDYDRHKRALGDALQRREQATATIAKLDTQIADLSDKMDQAELGSFIKDRERVKAEALGMSKDVRVEEKADPVIDDDITKLVSDVFDTDDDYIDDVNLST